MSKRFTKIICITTAAISVVTSTFLAGCGNFYGNGSLSTEGVFTEADAESNGGFAVTKGDYLYFINGIEGNTAVNDYGKPVKGTICRISKDNLEKRNYASVDVVVPQIAYSSNYNAGMFIYGDYIYYGTPSTAKNSEGVVQNSYLDMKSTKLDGTESMKNAYVQFPSTSYEYRFVEMDDTVYLMYVATSESLFEESTGVTNLHSYNTKSGEDTLLAYNVDNVLFDAQDKTNPRVYYTMKVHNYTSSSDEGYNQIYTVTADATEDKFKDKLSLENIVGWDDENDRYINCGTLVLDGVGAKEVNATGKTPFNHPGEEVNLDSYTYALKNYQNDTLFYTRSTLNNKSNYLFSLKDGNYAPISGNPSSEARLLSDGSNADTYKYIFENNEFKGVIISEADGGISINKVSNDGKLHLHDKKPGISDENYFKVVKSGSATLLSLDVKNSLLYYSVTGGNDLAIYRVDYSGTIADYEPVQVKDTNYTPVKLLDLDSSSTWYRPEFIDGYLLFASATTNMTAYNYIMVFDMNKDGGYLTNADIRALNEKYDGIKEIIDGYADSEKYPTEKYANLQKALNYAFYDGDMEYLRELAEVTNAKALEEDEEADPVYSEKTFDEIEAFLNPSADNAWKDYTDTKKVNGKDVNANTREYYYSVLGIMNDADKEAYGESLKTSYLVAYPVEEDLGWYGGLNLAAKICFIIGMCVIGLLVIGGAVVLTIVLIKRNKKLPQMKKGIKVDTTDDKSIDVYGNE